MIRATDQPRDRSRRAVLRRAAALHAGVPEDLRPARPRAVHPHLALSELAPTTVEADILAPLPDLGPFGSVALNFVLHCLPGTMAAKAVAIDNAASVLDTDGVLFGATILGESELHTTLSRSALRAKNRRGIFENLDDTEAGLTATLTRSFEQVQVEIVGSAAIFSAHGPRREGPGGTQEDRGWDLLL